MKNSWIIALAIVLSALSAFGQTVPNFKPPMIGSDGPIATDISQCGPPAVAHGYLTCAVETAGGGGILYYSINGGPWTQFQGLTVTGSVTPGHMVIFASPVTLQDGGAVPTIPANIVLSSTNSPGTGHAATWISPNVIGDGGTLPNFGSFKLTCLAFDASASGFNCPNASAQ